MNKFISQIIEESFSNKMNSFFNKPEFYGSVCIPKDGHVNLNTNYFEQIKNKINNDNILKTNVNLAFYFTHLDKNFRYLILLDNTFYFSSFNVKDTKIHLDDINEIEDDGKRTIYFYTKDGDEIALPKESVGTNDKKTIRFISNLFNKIVQEYNDKKTTLEARIRDKMEKKEFSDALIELNSYSKLFDINNPKYSTFEFYYIKNSTVLNLLNKKTEALFCVNKMIEISEKSDINTSDAYKIKAGLLKEAGKRYESLEYYSKSEKTNKDISRTIEINSLKENLQSEFINEFISLPIEKRKTILITDAIQNNYSKKIIALNINKLPKEIIFPINHPIKNSIYTCHPLKDNIYLPFEEYQKNLFKDEISEFCYLVQSLGATKVEIQSNTEDIKKDAKLNNANLDVKANYKVLKGNFNLKENINTNKSVNDLEEFIGIQHFKANKKTFVPDDLIWYKTNLKWQRLATQRLNGGLTYHKEIITSKVTQQSFNEIVENINAELKTLIIGGSINFDEKNLKENFIENKYRLSVIVEFDEPTDEISTKKLNTENSNKKVKENENLIKYKEDVLFMLEDDNIIDQNERKILDRKIKKYGLTEEESKKVENEVMSNYFSESELLYMEELKDIIEDGEITEIELKMLDRYAKKFGLDNETKNKINKIFNK